MLVSSRIHTAEKTVLVSIQHIPGGDDDQLFYAVADDQEVAFFAKVQKALRKDI